MHADIGGSDLADPQSDLDTPYGRMFLELSWLRGLGDIFAGQPRDFCASQSSQNGGLPTVSTSTTGGLDGTHTAATKSDVVASKLIQ